jgi:hypothetical protein
MKVLVINNHVCIVRAESGKVAAFVYKKGERPHLSWPQVRNPIVDEVSKLRGIMKENNSCNLKQL